MFILYEVGDFFFFSSRRRHTRCLSDWSSDVCSSDLVNAQVKGKIDATFVDAGEVSLKNVDEPMHVWCWGEMGAVAAPVPTIRSGQTAVPSSAVLPFSNMSGDPEQDYFADGLVEVS